MVGTSQGGYQSEETEIIEIDGKRFRRVQIEDFSQWIEISTCMSLYFYYGTDCFLRCIPMSVTKYRDSDVC